MADVQYTTSDSPGHNIAGRVLPLGRCAHQAWALAALLFAPDLIWPHVHRLDARQFDGRLWRQVARMALWQFAGQGAVDVPHISQMLVSVGDESPAAVELEFQTLRIVADALSAEVLAHAVSQLAGEKRS